MNPTRRTTRNLHNGNLACTASALVALVTVAAVMSSLPGVSVRSAILEARVVPVESATVRAVAAAVAAAARDLVGGERINAALPADQIQIAFPPASLPLCSDASCERVQCALLAERLIDLPPPVC